MKIGTAGCVFLWLSAGSFAVALDGQAAAHGGVPSVAATTSETREQVSGEPPFALSQALTAPAGRAGVIFTGRVVSITRNDPAGFVDIRFRIGVALRGCPRTGFYVLREWAGLWRGQAERYQVGQSFLMLLDSRGPSGMSAPVGGAEGAIPIVATGIPPIANAAGVVAADDGTSSPDAVVDLRWIAALHVMRQSGIAVKSNLRFATAASAAENPDDQAEIARWRPPARLYPVGGNRAAAVATTQPSLRSILSLLGADHRETHEAR